MKTKKEAQEKAEKLCKRLSKSLHGQWEPRVWENIGWHYQAVLKNGSIGVSCHNENNKKYYCAMGGKVGDHSATPAIWCDSNNYETPEDAVLEQLQKALTVSEKIQKIVNTNLDLLKQTKEVVK